ncbi:Abnormal spindle microcephaly-associated protein, partial [Globisporangium splendens]
MDDDFRADCSFKRDPKTDIRECSDTNGIPDAVKCMPSIRSPFHNNQTVIATASPQDPALLFETIQSDMDLLKQREKARKKKARIEKKRKQKRNILSLSQHPDGVLAMRYTKQLYDLADAERKLKELVTSQIEAEKAKLPLSFLFERNLDRTYCKEQSVRTITSIFTRLQHRMLCAAFERWHAFLLWLQKEDRKQAASHRSQVQALALFDKLASDAYIGTLDRALHRWRQITCEIVYKERQHAVTMIQVRYRQRRAKALLTGLKRVALDKEFKQKVEIQQLLKFEAYGTAMRWSTLRNGFNLLLQNICARRIQFFFRRIMLQRRIERRIVRKHAAIRIQCPRRLKLARKELARRKELFQIRQELEAHSATVIQRRVRGFLAKAALTKKRTWQSNKNQRALDIQRCWRKHRQRVELYRRFEVRRDILDAEIARLAQLRYEAMRAAAARDIERVFHGFQGRKACRAKMWERTLDLAVRRVQASWRRSKGRYALQLRFSAQRERIEMQRYHAALCIQCAYRVHLAKQLRGSLEAERLRRQQAATAIQRIFRGRRHRKQYQRTRRATITIQGGMKTKLARRERQRRLDRRFEETRQRNEASVRIQTWVRGTLARRRVSRMRELKAREELLTQNAALLIQKRTRGMEARKVTPLLQQVMQLVELEQSRQCRDSSRESSPLLQFMTEHYLHGGEDVVQHFTNTHCLWLEDHIRAAQTQIAKEDHAIVFLQRMYRGFVALVDYVVKKMQAIKRRELETAMAIEL